jgi:predicted transcriptional regulator
MHTTEDKLKELILSRYKSLHEFSQTADIPHSTFISVLKRGVGNSNISSVIKICNALNISVDALANGKIEYKYKETKVKSVMDMKDIVNDVKAKVLSADTLIIDGNPIDDAGVKSIFDALDVGVEIVRRKKR